MCSLRCARLACSNPAYTVGSSRSLGARWKGRDSNHAEPCEGNYQAVFWHSGRQRSTTEPPFQPVPCRHGATKYVTGLPSQGGVRPVWCAVNTVRHCVFVAAGRTVSRELHQSQLRRWRGGGDGVELEAGDALRIDPDAPADSKRRRGESVRPRRRAVEPQKSRRLSNYALWARRSLRRLRG